MPLDATNLDGAGDGSLSVVADGPLIRIAGTGFWSEAEVDAHFRTLRRIVATARARHFGLKVLVDLRGSAVQTRETSERIERETRAIWTATDRVAMVVRSGLARMQMNRIVDGRAYQMFDRIDLARQWLDDD